MVHDLNWNILWAARVRRIRKPNYQLKLNFIAIRMLERWVIYIVNTSILFEWNEGKMHSRGLNLLFFYLKGTPILQEILDHCHYRFQWPTNVICPMHVSAFREKDCGIYNDQLNKTTDVRTIFKDGLINVSLLTWIWCSFGWFSSKWPVEFGRVECRFDLCWSKPYLGAFRIGAF